MFKTGIGRVLVFVIACLLGTLCSAGLAVVLPGCSSAPTPPHSPATQAQLASVVVLVEQVALWQEPSLSSEFEHTDTYVSAWRGRCNAFALERKSGELYLVTAAHCLRERALGSVVRYLPPDGWGIDRAVLVKLEPVRDYAELQPERSGGLEPLQLGPVPGSGEPVLSVSAFFQEQAPGRSIGELSGPWFGTTQSIEHGWSGSPVLDARGRAWGFVAKCNTEQGKCTRGAVVGAL